MQKFVSEYASPVKSVHVFEEEDWQKRMAHGHYCPYCKAEIIDYSTCVIYYIIPINYQTAKKYGKKVLFHRNNRRVSCPDCQGVARDIIKSPYDQEKFALQISGVIGSSNGRTKEIPEKRGDTYREKVLKKNGFDPTLRVNYKIYSIEDKVGEAEGTHALFLKVFSEVKDV